MVRLPSETTVAVMARLLPGTIPPEALATFVDQHFDEQLGHADDRDGLLPRAELLPLGLRLLDDIARSAHGAPFAQLPQAPWLSGRTVRVRFTHREPGSGRLRSRMSTRPDRVAE